LAQPEAIPDESNLENSNLDKSNLDKSTPEPTNEKEAANQ
jgi:hypothetical protein